jgi:hypothetical protein
MQTLLHSFAMHFCPGKRVPIPTSWVPVVILMLRRKVDFTGGKEPNFLGLPTQNLVKIPMMFRLINFIEKSSS